MFHVKHFNCKKPPGRLHFLLKNSFYFLPERLFRDFERYQESTALLYLSAFLTTLENPKMDLQAKEEKCKQHWGFPTLLVFQCFG